MQRCSQLTRQGRPCPFEGDRTGPNGLPVCHIHDPTGTFRKNVRAFREARRSHRPRMPKAMQNPKANQPLAQAAFSSVLPPIQIDPNWSDPCPFEPK